MADFTGNLIRSVTTFVDENITGALVQNMLSAEKSIEGFKSVHTHAESLAQSLVNQELALNRKWADSEKKMGSLESQNSALQVKVSRLEERVNRVEPEISALRALLARSDIPDQPVKASPGELDMFSPDKSKPPQSLTTSSTFKGFLTGS